VTPVEGLIRQVSMTATTNAVTFVTLVKLSPIQKGEIRPSDLRRCARVCCRFS
jgi:hypothetical protein